MQQKVDLSVNQSISIGIQTTEAECTQLHIISIHKVMNMKSL